MLLILQNFCHRSNIRSHLDKVSKLFIKILPIYWAFLTYMLLRPGIENLEFPFMFNGIDKLMHLGVFSMLGFCFLAAIPRIKFYYFIQIMIIYGLATEILQDEMHLGRSLEGLDLVADTIGVLIGYVIFQKLKTLFFND